MNSTSTKLLLAFLAAAGLACAQPTVAPPNLDHFNCYFTDGPQFTVTATLQDQFDIGFVETVKDLRLIRFCNPVQKTLRNGKVTPILHPDAHLALYLLNPQVTTPRVVVAVNQFGPQVLRTSHAVILGVPSGKVLPPATGGQPQPPPIPNPQELDHFKCYLASGKSISTVVSLKDQFQTDLASVLQPVLFCNPVNKTVTTVTANGTTATTITKITNPAGHLICYVTAQKPFSQTIFYDNQFVPFASTPVTNPDLLCVPTLKLQWSAVPPPASFNSIEP